MFFNKEQRIDIYLHILGNSIGYNLYKTIFCLWYRAKVLSVVIKTIDRFFLCNKDRRITVKF